MLNNQSIITETNLLSDFIILDLNELNTKAQYRHGGIPPIIKIRSGGMR